MTTALPKTLCAWLALLVFATAGCSGGGEPAPMPADGATEMSIEVLTPGDGAQPAATDQVRVHYHGTFTDGRTFDSSVDRGKPAVFPLNGVIPCWTQAVQTMKVGGKIRVTCPPHLAYGARGAGPIPPNATLVFEIELLGVL